MKVNHTKRYIFKFCHINYQKLIFLQNLLPQNKQFKHKPSAEVTAARIILSGCILSCSGAAPTDVTVVAGWPEVAVSVCDGLIAIWIVGADDEDAATDEPQLGMLTAGGLFQQAQCD